MHIDGNFVGGAPLEIRLAEVRHDGDSLGKFIQILVGTEQVGAELGPESLRALDVLCTDLYSYALTTTLAMNWDDVNANLVERQCYNEVLDLGFAVNDFDVDKLALDFYSLSGKEPIDLATIAFTGEELKGFVMHVAALFGLDCEFGDPDEGQLPTLGEDPFAV